MNIAPYCGKASEKIKEMERGMKDDASPDRRGRIKLRIDRCWYATTGQTGAAAVATAMCCSILNLNQEGTKENSHTLFYKIIFSPDLWFL